MARLIHPDCLVIGAGLEGVFAALHMADQGLQVVVIDTKSMPTKLAGIEAERLLFFYHRPDCLVKLNHKSLILCKKFLQDNDKSSAIENISLIRAVTDIADEKQARIEYEQSFAQETTVDFFPQGKIGELELKMSSKVAGAIVHHQTPSVKSEQLYNALWSACQNHDRIALEWDTKAFGIDIEKGAVERVRTRKGPFETRRVMVAAGAGSLGILAGTGFQLPAVKEVTFRLVGRPARIGKSYFIKEYRPPVKSSTGKLQVSLSAFLGTDQYVSVGDGKELAVSKFASESTVIREVGRHFTEILPEYRDLQFLRAVTRCDIQTVDGLPVVGCLPNATGLYLALCGGDDQRIIAPAVGKSVAHWIIDEKPLEKLRPMFANRFAQTAPGGEKSVAE